VHLGPYTIVRRLAVGGMAEVLLALREGPGGFARPVALKRILPHLAGQADIVALFENEARLAARMSHPGIVQVHDFSEIEGQYVLAQEYVAGADLAHVARRAHGPVPPVIVAAILASLTGALHHAHERGVVHGDVSPSNVLLGFDGAVKLADFGVAQRGGGGGRRGKRSYAAPEQLAGLPFDRRADIYAVGVLGLELLSGRRFTGALPPARSPLHEVLARALHWLPADRWATAEAMQLALERVLVAEGAAALGPRLARWMATLFSAAEIAGPLALVEEPGEVTAKLPAPGRRPDDEDTGPPSASSSAIPVPEPRPFRRGLFFVVAGLVVAGASALVASHTVDIADQAAALPSFAAAPLSPPPPPPAPLEPDCRSIRRPAGGKVASCPENASGSTTSSSASGASATSSSTR
jgi:serine/threonine-protein kinase